ncbi:MAG TPA: hypothetical protein VMW91_12180 [Desulfosporosinus sp.]|nr:hypothetical protein [Desulfosporosinus sp.]
MNVKQLVDRVQAEYAHGIPSRSIRLRPRFVYNKLQTAWPMFAQKLLKEKAQDKDEWIYLTLPCIELHKAPAHDCPCVPPVGKKFYKSVIEVPSSLNVDGRPFRSVTTIDGSVEYDYTTWEDVARQKYNKYTASKPAYFLKNGYLYLKDNPKEIVLLAVTGIFEDPVAAASVVGYCTGCREEADPVCFDPLTVEFPVMDEILEPILEYTINSIAKYFHGFPEDKSTNSESDGDKTRKR